MTQVRDVSVGHLFIMKDNGDLHVYMRTQSSFCILDSVLPRSLAWRTLDRNIAKAKMHLEVVLIGDMVASSEHPSPTAV